MKLADAVVFVTGANRGIGRAYAAEALKRGARKVYAGARDPSRVDLPGVVPVAIDVTDAASVAAAAAQCGDVTVLINNAGTAELGGFLADDSIAAARRMLEVNFFGPLIATRAFAPVLAANGGGAVVNVLSIASWLSRPMLAVYGSTKSAAWSLTNGLRNDLAPQGTQVLGVHMAFVDTDLTKGITGEKISPDTVAAQTFDALEAGQKQVLIDERTKMVHAHLSAAEPIYLAALP